MDFQDKTLVKRWVFSLKLMYASLFLSLGIVMYYASVINRAAILNDLFDNGIYGVFHFWILWHCAYKKRGYIYLFLTILISIYNMCKHILVFFAQAKNIISFTSELGINRLSTEYIVGSTLLCTGALLSALALGYFIYMSCLLFKVNKKITNEREKKFMANSPSGQVEAE